MIAATHSLNILEASDHASLHFKSSILSTVFEADWASSLKICSVGNLQFLYAFLVAWYNHGGVFNIPNAWMILSNKVTANGFELHDFNSSIEATRYR